MIVIGRGHTCLVRYVTGPPPLPRDQGQTPVFTLGYSANTPSDEFALLNFSYSESHVQELWAKYR